MNDRPTPETDAMAVTCYGESGIENSFGFLAVPIKDCRKLERERDEAREWQNVKVTKNGETHCLGTLVELLERERDEARAVAENLVKYAHEYLYQLESWGLESWGEGYDKYKRQMKTIRAAIAGCDKWKEAVK